MGNCSTEKEETSIPEQTQPVQQKPFVKPQPCIFVIGQEEPQPLKIYGQKGIKATFAITSEIQPDAQLKKTLEKKEKFIDHSFRHDKKSIGQKLHLEHLEWKRPGQFGKGDPIFFSGELETLDLKQGRLSNSYFSSAFSALSFNEDLFNQIIPKIFNQEMVSSNRGIYGIWLFIDGLWKCIVIDELVPVCMGDYPFTRYLNESWIMYVEKAYAKQFKSYQNIEKGLLGQFLTNLTGAPCSYLCRDSQKLISPDQAWQFIRDAMEMRYITSVSTECNDKNQYQNRQSTFSYSVLDCQEVYILTATKKKRQRILKLDNSWGRYEWKGRWSEYSDVWSEELRHQLNYEKADDSILWINIEDMLDNFGQVCVCKYHPEYLNTSFPLTFSEGENDLKGVFLHIHERVQGFLSLVQKDFRHFFKDYQYSLSRMILLCLSKETGKATKIMAETSDCDSYCTIQLVLDPGLYYVLVEMDWKSSFTRNAVLNFYGDAPITMQVDKKMPSVDQIFYQLCKLDQEGPKKLQIHTYPDDPNIQRVRGEFAGYIYYHYTNNSTQNKYLSEVVKLNGSKNVQVCNQYSPDEYSVKIGSGEQKLVKIKVKKDGNGYYELKTTTENKLVEKYTTQNLMEMLRKKPSSLRRREIDGQKIDVFIKMFEYSGGVALLYENRMSKFSYIEEITFQIRNLTLDNEKLPADHRINIQLEPDSERLFSFLVVDPSHDYTFKTKVQYYLGTPEFTF